MGVTAGVGDGRRTRLLRVGRDARVEPLRPSAAPRPPRGDGHVPPRPDRARGRARHMRLGAGVVLVACALGACGGQAHLDMARARSEIARSLSSTYAVDVGPVRCPGTVDAEDGGTFSCTVTISGQPLTV